MVKINILPPVTPTLTDAKRARGIEMAKADRQAVFHGDCAACHVKPGQGKYGKLLYDADCAICHEGEHRATMVPDLHTLKVPTNVEFWRTWICPWQSRLAHARIFHHRRRPAHGHANRHARRLSEHDDTVAGRAAPSQ